MLLAQIPKDWIPILFVAGIAVLAFTVSRMRFRRAKPPAGGGAAAPGVRPGEMRQITQELSSTMVEVHEAARQICAQIDNRYQKLDALLAEADARIKRLEQLQTAAGAQAVTPVPPAERVEDPKYKPIYNMADQGKTPREIAQQLGAQPGEIELILALRGR